jgi:putative heme-binding domain-containing protein
LGRTYHPKVAPALLQRLGGLSEADRAVALTTLTSRPPYAQQLLAAVQEGAVDKKVINSLHIRQLRNLRNQEVDTLLDRTWGAVGETSVDAQATVAKLRQLYEEAPKWAFSARRGQEIYQQLCAACHVLDGTGGNLGPELTGSWRNGADYFFENIVDPNAVVGIDYQLNVITLKDGSVISGMVERITDTTMIVRTMTESLRLARTDIAERQVMEQSLMPPGLLEALSERELIELMNYLTERRP